VEPMGALHRAGLKARGEDPSRENKRADDLLVGLIVKSSGHRAFRVRNRADALIFSCLAAQRARKMVIAL
jgi:hypothetical protein